jgi:c-di-AMP phosphodiesterase-like protein
MNNVPNYRQLSIITLSILLCLLIVAGVSSSVNWIGALMALIPVVLILFAFFILRSKEESTKTLEEGEDWYEH